MNDNCMTPEKPAEGIMKLGDFGPAKFYKVDCSCGSDECAHQIEVEADDMNVTVSIYHDVTSKFWEKNRWKQIWQLLIKGYIDTQTTTVMNEQTALNYAEALKSAIRDVKDFRNERNES